MTSPGSVAVQDATGAFTLDAATVASRFGWSAEHFTDLMRRQMVTSRVERGEGADEGHWRLSVRCGNRQWQAIVDAGGVIVSEAMDFVGAA